MLAHHTDTAEVDAQTKRRRGEGTAYHVCVQDIFCVKKRIQTAERDPHILGQFFPDSKAISANEHAGASKSCMVFVLCARRFVVLYFQSGLAELIARAQHAENAPLIVLVEQAMVAPCSPTVCNRDGHVVIQHLCVCVCVCVCVCE